MRAPIVYEAGDPHSPNRLTSYLAIHVTAMRRHLDEGFILDNPLRLDPIGDGFYWMKGRVQCQGSLHLDIEKRLRGKRDAQSIEMVETIDYSYTAAIHRVGTLFRYDSPHEHRSCHHVHRYDVLSGDKGGNIIEHTRGEWPSLSNVIEEFKNWYYGNFAELQKRRPV